MHRKAKALCTGDRVGYTAGYEVLDSFERHTGA